MITSSWIGVFTKRPGCTESTSRSEAEDDEKGTMREESSTHEQRSAARSSAMRQRTQSACADPARNRQSSGRTSAVARAVRSPISANPWTCSSVQESCGVYNIGGDFQKLVTADCRRPDLVPRQISRINQSYPLRSLALFGLCARQKQLEMLAALAVPWDASPAT